MAKTEVRKFRGFVTGDGLELLGEEGPSAFFHREAKEHRHGCHYPATLCVEVPVEPVEPRKWEGEGEITASEFASAAESPKDKLGNGLVLFSNGTLCGEKVRVRFTIEEIPDE